MIDPELTTILDECAKLRGCHPLLNRITAQFFEWLMTNKSNELLPLAQEFRQHCIKMYITNPKYDEVYSRLAQGTLHAHRVYTCPNCGVVNATHKFGEHPLCPYCNAPVTYTYEEDI